MKISPCGIDCGGCKMYQTECQGCRSLSGKPDWVAQVNLETCPLYDCPVNQHGYDSCAECDQLPCKAFTDLRDPSMTDEEYETGLAERLAALKAIKQ